MLYIFRNPVHNTSITIGACFCALSMHNISLRMHNSLFEIKWMYN